MNDERIISLEGIDLDEEDTDGSKTKEILERRGILSLKSNRVDSSKTVEITPKIIKKKRKWIISESDLSK